MKIFGNSFRENKKVPVKKTHTILFQMLKRFEKPQRGEVVFGEKNQSTILKQIETKITLKKRPTF